MPNVMPWDNETAVESQILYYQNALTRQIGKKEICAVSYEILRTLSEGVQAFEHSGVIGPTIKIWLDNACEFAAYVNKFFGQRTLRCTRNEQRLAVKMCIVQETLNETAITQMLAMCDQCENLGLADLTNRIFMEIEGLRRIVMPIIVTLPTIT